MNPELERRLATFVDREREMEVFRNMLDGALERRILVLWGGGGIGKSSLLAGMIHECGLRGRSKVEVVWTDTRLYDSLGVMRKIRDDFGPAGFNEFTDRVNYFTAPDYELTLNVRAQGQISVAQHAHFQGGTVRDVAGVVVRDLNITAPRPDLSISEADRTVQLTDLFLASLSAAVRERPLVIFLDAVEKLTLETELWIWGELLPAIRDDRIANTLVVFSGRKKPDLSAWALIAAEAELRPLEREHIQQYLKKRGIPEEEIATLTKALWAITKGNALLLANHVDAFLAENEVGR